MDLKLTRPIAFFDIESTGLDVSKDRIVEIAILKIYPDGKEDMKSFRINPGIPIPAETTEIHGISDADVKDEPSFKDLAGNIAKIFENSDLAGYNCLKFDVPMLMEEFLRSGIHFDMSKVSIVDVQNIFHQMEQRTLSAAYKFYCNKEIVNAHSADADTYATYEVLKAQLDKYKDTVFTSKGGEESKPVQNDIKKLGEFSSVRDFVDFAGRIARDKNGVEVFNFGKHKGRPVVEVFERESSYYDWMMKGDFPEYTKKIITEIRLKSHKSLS